MAHGYGIYIDGLSATLFLLVALLLAVVLRFSHTAMAGEPDRRRFTTWMVLTGASVLALTIAGNLLLFTLFWSATSLCLHKLLVFYPNRPGARLAARKKLIFSRLGDACLLVALVLVYREFGTWEFDALFRSAEQLTTSAALPSGQHKAIGLLLVVGAMLKSAQFPFHSWLPDTMETPTPVSALMHAGIINAGGFLVIRMSPLIELSPWALTTLAAMGGVTAVFAALVMLTQASVKRGLAFSTVAQMGFMMFECGLGAFGLALLHLVAHAIYKAYAFLSSGSVVGSRAVLVQRAPVPAGTAIIAAVVAVAGTAGAAWLVGVNVRDSMGAFILTCVFTTASATLVARIWRERLTPARALVGVIVAPVLSAVYLTLHQAFTAIAPHVAPMPAHEISPTSAVTVASLFGALFALDAWIPSALGRPWVRTLYVHARNGFYFNTFANRMVAAVWPVSSANTETRR